MGKLLEVVQGIDLTVPGGLHLYDAVLPIAARAVLSVADLIATDDAILQLLLGRLWVWGRARGRQRHSDILRGCS